MYLTLVLVHLDSQIITWDIFLLEFHLCILYVFQFYKQIGYVLYPRNTEALAWMYLKLVVTHFNVQVVKLLSKNGAFYIKLPWEEAVKKTHR